MAVLTSTLTVNAAFLAEIKEEDLQLRELLNAAVRDASDTGAEQIKMRDRVEMYHALRDQLALHFALEDAYGYFHDAIDETPPLSSMAERLSAQHDSLFRQMCDIIDAAECILYREYNALPETDLFEAFMNFYGILIEHEQAEIELIATALDNEICTKG
ncbi:MAG: hypothetical protein CMJ74_10840 [Planctomycetaceae bacterium]|nr:hypothetical protein [Planctomycetaceae bacterium]